TARLLEPFPEKRNSKNQPVSTDFPGLHLRTNKCREGINLQHDQDPFIQSCFSRLKRAIRHREKGHGKTMGGWWFVRFRQSVWVGARPPVLTQGKVFVSQAHAEIYCRKQFPGYPIEIPGEKSK